MIIWRGFGALVVLVVLICVGGLQWLASTIVGPEATTQIQRFLIPIGLVIAAVIVWPLGRFFNKPTTTFDPRTGRQVTVSRGHSLFFINMEYWSPILLVLAVVFLIAGFFVRI
ncbi:hypothetical protein EI42_04174 [Thermosporothrix hazakensis]|uniref:Uncharacterized protein n=2 Tax=Thermosporothrix TaxID=768650 RepID=A0A326U470_THEHA|nr:hypothetical protein [Thermosporothrix hazakensis]PZW25681.1 hypothetical protein EI42_04174 [Thermosporothrix hazakensis]BBH89977.1 hypothetical protein KTC_47280 [Thermosporothrix sp. COM3]GCE48176.1 hypothetical protein KTH_30450 [Thermosporothrix hazakensis]